MRKSAVSGSFYPSSKTKLLDFIKDTIEKATPENADNAHAYVAPHAGYAYSGETAAFTYKSMSKNRLLEIVETFVIIGPNHTGNGRPLSVSMENWETPIGISVNDRELSRSITESSEYIDVNEDAHEYEHSIELQLPFIEHLFPEKRVSFICMGDQSIKASETLFKAIINASKELNRRVIVIASSDFNHYESVEITKKKDSVLLESAIALDYKKFNVSVEESNDSICGYGPVTVAMMFAKHMGARKGLVLKYSNSGDKTGDYSSVVGYSSIAFI